MHYSWTTICAGFTMSVAGAIGQDVHTARRSTTGDVAGAGNALLGDYTGDGDVDWQDYFPFHACSRSGPGVVVIGCDVFDSDYDLDVDLRDTAAVHNAFTGSLTVGACPNGVRDLGETCDDGNTAAGDGCSPSCDIELPHDSCASALLVPDGTRDYDSAGATTDGPDEAVECAFSGDSQIGSDLWYCYRATCSGPLTVSLCGSEYDTKLAVYEGCHCPTEAPLACSDDDCGTGVSNVQSRVTIDAELGRTYMIRAGGFEGLQGPGRLTIHCDLDACAEAVSACFLPSPTGDPGCADEACCANTCVLDQFCCDVIWDEICAGEALGVCTGSFPACLPTAGSCLLPAATPGCSNVTCCNLVCLRDPFCCLTEWDSACVGWAEQLCP